MACSFVTLGQRVSEAAGKGGAGVKGKVSLPPRGAASLTLIASDGVNSALGKTTKLCLQIRKKKLKCSSGLSVACVYTNVPASPLPSVWVFQRTVLLVGDC